MAKITGVKSLYKRLDLEELGAGDALLHDHAGDGDHGKAAVVELLALHLLESERVRRLQAERVEAQVARRVRGLHGPPLDIGVLKGGQDGEHLDDSDRENDGRPEGLERGLLERAERRPVDRAAEERVEDLSQRVSERGQHGDAAVLHLDLAVEADLALGGGALGAVIVRAEAGRVEEAKRPGDARQRLRESVGVELRVGHRHLVLDHGEDRRRALLHRDNGDRARDGQRRRAGERERGRGDGKHGCVSGNEDNG
eukprot:scaffold26226_cov79-Phaeocystis_antarctica.AAC.4